MLIAYSHYSIKLHIYRAYRAYNAIYASHTVRFDVCACLEDHLACCEDGGDGLCLKLESILGSGWTCSCSRSAWTVRGTHTLYGEPMLIGHVFHVLHVPNAVYT